MRLLTQYADADLNTFVTLTDSHDNIDSFYKL